MRSRLLKTTIVAVAMVALLALSSWAGGSGEAGAPKGKVELSFVGSFAQGSEVFNALDSVIKEFNAKNTSIVVTYENIPYDNFMEKLTARVIGDRAPDSGILLDRWATAMVAQNALLALDSYLPQGYKDSFVKSAWDYSVVDGKSYAIPAYANVQALLYNKDIMQKAGIKVPDRVEDMWKFDDLLRVARIIKQKNLVQYPFAYWPNSTPSRLGQYLVGDGGSVLSPDFKSVTVDSPVALRHFQGIRKSFEEGLAPPDNWTAKGTPDPMLVDFMNQKVAMLTGSGNFQTVILEKTIAGKFRWGFTLMPTTLGTPIELVAFKKTKNPKEVVKFLQYIASPDVMAKIAIEANTVPTRIDMPIDKLQYKVAPEEMKFLMKQLALASPQIQGEMKQAYWSEIDMMIRKKLELLSIGSLSAEQAAKESADESKKIITKYQ